MLLLGLLVALVLASRAGAVAALLATSAVLVRWGSPSLTAVAGDQAVLGPAIVVGSTAAAASAWLAAAAIVLAVPRLRRRPAAEPAPATRVRGEPLIARRPAVTGPTAGETLIVAGVLGVVAGAIAAGPTLPDGAVVRAAGVLAATVAALVLSRLPHPRALAVAAGAAALVLAALG